MGLNGNQIYYLEGVDGQLEIYEDSVIITRNGRGARSIHGRAGDKSIPMESIKYITLKTGTIWSRGEIAFGVAGSVDRTNWLDTNKNRSNTILFTKDNNEKAQKIKTYIEEQLLRYQNKPLSDKTPDAADEILKYKNLLDIGAITQEEFELKKKQLLGI